MKITFQIHIVLPTYRSKCEIDRPFDNNTQHTVFLIGIAVVGTVINSLKLFNRSSSS